jgi:Zincin-like metallopeptidase
VQVPPFECFRDAKSFAATLAHECVHWTKHDKRLHATSAALASAMKAAHPHARSPRSCGRSWPSTGTGSGTRSGGQPPGRATGAPLHRLPRPELLAQPGTRNLARPIISPCRTAYSSARARALSSRRSRQSAMMRRSRARRLRSGADASVAMRCDPVQWASIRGHPAGARGSYTAVRTIERATRRPETCRRPRRYCQNARGTDVMVNRAGLRPCECATPSQARRGPPPAASVMRARAPRPAGRMSRCRVRGYRSFLVR